MFYEHKHLHRRRFLQVSAGGAACGLAAASVAAALDDKSLIDTHVYLGRWPLRRLAADAPAELVAQLRRAGVTQVWAGTFDGIFHKDVHGANLRLVEACRSAGDGLMIPIGSVNPTLPDWEEDVRRCHEKFKMPGIRLHPHYHGYTLGDPRFARLLELATARKLFVQLVVQLNNERQQWLTPRIAQVDLAPLTQVVRHIRGLRLLIAGLVPAETAPPKVPLSTNAYFDFATATNNEAMLSLQNHVPGDRIVYGSAAPLIDVTPGITLLQQAKLPAEQVHAIYSDNARRLMR